jgi:hypothetical protein
MSPASRNDPTLADAGGSRFGERHMRVDLDVQARYPASVV